MKRFISITLAALILLCALSACSGEKATEDGIRALSFSGSDKVEEMQKIDGEKVSIIGYMSTLSPINGEFMYLMNLPYQNCPFCIPNTTELSNTMAVYAPEGKSFEFTDRAIKVTGILEFGEYVDEFGYEYSYRIKDGTYTEVDTSEMSEKMKLWQQLAATNVISDVYNMYEYINFLCFWPTYTVQFESGKDYLYPSDALQFIKTEGAQYNYGYAEDYFDNLIAVIKEVNETEFDVLVNNILKAEKLAQKALAALENGEYTTVEEYSNAFGDGRTQCLMNDSAVYEIEMETIYREFAYWLAEWEI